MIDVSRLKAQLNNTGLQNKNTPLYQFLEQLLGVIRGINTEVQSSSGTGGITNITQTVLNFEESSSGEDGLSIPGAAGTQGVAGPAGLTGTTILAEDGVDGIDGFPGLPGPQGPQGIAGNTGSQGPMGVSLFPEDGIDGTDGFGVPGQSGVAGSAGIQGAPGVNILVSDGLDAEMLPVIPGAVGPTGNTGALGSPGVNILVSDGLDADILPIIPGPQGIPGAAGAIGSSSGGVGSDVVENTDLLQAIFGLDGNGTPGTLPRFRNGRLLSDSLVSESGGILTIAERLLALATGLHSIGAGGSGAQSILEVNGSSASGSGPYLEFSIASAPKSFIGTEAGIIGGTSVNAVWYVSGANVAVIYTNNVRRWGVNGAGDRTQGASDNIVDSIGVPTIGAFAGGVSPTLDADATDYAHILTFNSNTSVTVNFGHTFSKTPVIAISNSLSVTAFSITSISTTSYTIFTNSASASTVYVLIRGR